MMKPTTWLQLTWAASVAVHLVPAPSFAQAAPEDSAKVCGVVSIGPADAETELHAANFATKADAERWAKEFGPDARLEVLSGTCASQSDNCIKIYQPVCAFLNFSAERTFGNRCELRVATLQAAGDHLRAGAVISHPGECK